jgi:hypothetical protein
MVPGVHLRVPRSQISRQDRLLHCHFPLRRVDSSVDSSIDVGRVNRWNAVFHHPSVGAIAVTGSLGRRIKSSLLLVQFGVGCAHRSRFLQQGESKSLIETDQKLQTFTVHQQLPL